MVYKNSNLPALEKLIERIKTMSFSVQTQYKFLKIRKTIKELGGTMPEELPTPKKSLKQLEKESKKELMKK